MNIDEFIPGSAYIILSRESFKSEDSFNAILGFLMLPKNKDTIKINVNHGCLTKNDTGGFTSVKANYE